MNAARPIHLESQASDLLRGTVVLCQGNTFSVTLKDRGEILATRAASCLLRPQPRDRVLVLVTPDEPAFILAVLTRDADEPARLVFDGDARLEAPSGRIDIAADAGLGITTRKTLSMFADKLSLKGVAAEIVAKSASLVAELAKTSAKDIAVVAERYDLFVDRIAERSKRVYRFVEELDQLRARHFDYRAEHSAQITADNTVVTARQVAKIDGEQVHIG